MLGLVLPWFGPMSGLFVISPIMEMDVLESRWITKDTQCFMDPVNVCNATSQYQYYFWNITNPDQVGEHSRCIKARCARACLARMKFNSAVALPRAVHGWHSATRSTRARTIHVRSAAILSGSAAV